MKAIELTKGYIAILDDEDYEWAKHWRWAAQERDGGRVYAGRKENIFGRGVLAYLHRLIMLGDKKYMIDHWNGDTLDNRRCNLRIVERSKNIQNQKLAASKTSQYRGVRIVVQVKGVQWIAGICKDCKNRYLGTYKTEIEAAKAYDAEAIRLYGEDANVNFPTKKYPPALIADKTKIPLKKRADHRRRGRHEYFVMRAEEIPDNVIQFRGAEFDYIK